MPARSPRQQRFMGAELGRALKGEPTRTGMGKNKLREFARKPAGGYRLSPKGPDALHRALKRGH